MAQVPVEIDVAALRAVAAELDGVEGALARIDDGTYGSCTACGAAIDDAALEVDPLAGGCATHHLA